MTADPDDGLDLTLHEAGHATAAVALGFAFRSIAIRGAESGVVGWAGETNSSAADIGPEHPDGHVRRRSAVVAMAGREGRRLLFPDADADWYCLDLDDRMRALALLGRTRTRKQLLDDPGNPEDESLLAPVVEEARNILLSRRAAAERLARHLLHCGFPVALTGAEAQLLLDPPPSGTGSVM